MSQDGFGCRSLTIDPASGDAVEVLSFAATLATSPEFAAATAERVARLARVRHPLYARVRKIDRPSNDALLLHSDYVAGWRLSDVLTHVEREGWRLDISTVLAVMRQLLPAVALFSRHQRDATIGTIGPERLILTPQGRLVVAEFVLAPGLEQVQFSRARLWREFRVALPPSAGQSRIPPSTDVVGMGIVALSLLLGRLLRDDEYLVSLGDLSESLTESSGDSTRPLSATFRTWLARALQFDGAASFETTQEAQVAFEELLAKERSYVTNSAQLNQFVAAYERVAGDPPAPSPLPSPVVPAPTPAAALRVELPPIDEEMAPAPVAAVSPERVEPAARVPHAAPVDPVPTVEPPEMMAPVAVEAPVEPAGLAAPGDPAEPAAPIGDAVAAVTPAALVAPAAFIAPIAPATATAPRLPAELAPSTPGVPAWRRYAVLILAAIAVGEAVALASLLSRGEAASPDRGELVVQSRPVAARVTIDGDERGITPLTTELSAGSHVLEVRVGRSEPRVIPLMIRPGVQTGLYVELQSVATVGGLEVRTDPPRARVTVSGQDRGVTPLVLRDLPPGEMEVVIRLGGREVRQTVRIEPGITSQLVVPLGR